MLYKRPDSANWWCRFYVGRTEIRRSTGTTDYDDAQAFEIKLRHDLWRQQQLGEPADYTWDDAAVRWLEENPGKRSLDKDTASLRWLMPHPRGRRHRQLPTEELTRIRNVKA